VPQADGTLAGVVDGAQLAAGIEDLAAGGRDDELFFHDTERGLTPVDRRSLDLADAEPRIEGSVDVKLKDGRDVKCTTVFSLLRSRLAAYSPEQAEALCGTPAPVIRALAKLFAEARAGNHFDTGTLREAEAFLGDPLGWSASRGGVIEA